MENLRIYMVAVLAVILLAIVAWIRPVEDHGMPIANFWSSKFTNERNFDIVAAGDSRILHGLSMAPFSELGIGTGHNFGFRGSPANVDYYSNAVKYLGDEGQRILVLGITPNGFTEYARHSNGYKQKKQEYLGRSPAVPYWIGYAEQALQPMTIGEVYRTIIGRQNPLQLTYHSDGWIESAHEKPNEDYSLRFFNVHFDNNLAQPANVAAVCAYIKKCTDEGIRVFALRPPISESMSAVEDKTSGFEYKQFVKDFSEAGGVWLEVDPEKFGTYDGSHLNADSAIAFSNWVASQIQAKIDTEK